MTSDHVGLIFQDPSEKQLHCIILLSNWIRLGLAETSTGVRITTVLHYKIYKHSRFTCSAEGASYTRISTWGSTRCSADKLLLISYLWLIALLSSARQNSRPVIRTYNSLCHLPVRHRWRACPSVSLCSASTALVYIPLFRTNAALGIKSCFLSEFNEINRRKNISPYTTQCQAPPPAVCNPQ